jgi:hypothetical protein
MYNNIYGTPFDPLPNELEWSEYILVHRDVQTLQDGKPGEVDKSHLGW